MNNQLKEIFNNIFKKAKPVAFVKVNNKEEFNIVVKQFEKMFGIFPIFESRETCIVFRRNDIKHAGPPTGYRYCKDEGYTEVPLELFLEEHPIP